MTQYETHPIGTAKRIAEPAVERMKNQCLRCLGFGEVAYLGELVDCLECSGTGRRAALTKEPNNG